MMVRKMNGAHLAARDRDLCPALRPSLSAVPCLWSANANASATNAAWGSRDASARDRAMPLVAGSARAHSHSHWTAWPSF